MAMTHALSPHQFLSAVTASQIANAPTLQELVEAVQAQGPLF